MDTSRTDSMGEAAAPPVTVWFAAVSIADTDSGEARSLLRSVLALAAGGPPEDWLVSPAGTGALNTRQQTAWFTSVSCAQDLLTVAASEHSPVGIATVALTERARWLAPSLEFLHPLEEIAINALDAADRARAYLALWAAKTATTKALGRGPIPFNAFNVADTGLGCSAVQGLAGVHRALALPLPPGYVGSLAVVAGQRPVCVDDLSAACAPRPPAGRCARQP
jgi:phosphopantetheinyl transferase